MVVYNIKIMLIIESEHVHINYIPWYYWDVMMYHLVLWLCMLKHKTCSAIFIGFLISSFMLTQYIDSHARSFFSVPLWLMWSWSSTCVLSTSDIITHLSFIMMPSISAMSSLNEQYALMSCCTWSLIYGHPAMMYPLSHCKCSSYAVTCYIYAIDMYSGIFVDVCIASTLTSMPHISSYLFSVWLCLDSQSAMKNSGPGLYIILTLYWCIHRRMHWICCDRVATSFLNIATRSLWLVIILTSLAKQ